MRDPNLHIRPETRTLDDLIRARTTHAQHGDAGDALLFLGNPHHAFPVLVVQDPVLEPVDKLVWMILCQRARAVEHVALFPSYAEIARLANISSTSTVSRAIAILRAARWLSLCARERDGNGRFGANVYALHDEPLPLPDAVHLDSGYMAFLHAAVGHHHARVRRVASAVSASLGDDIASGTDVLAPVGPVERRLEAARAMDEDGERRYFSFSGARMATLSNAPTPSSASSQDQKSKVEGEDCQKPKAVLRSSNKTITTTTTSTLREMKTPTGKTALLDTLVYPPRLKDNQRALAARYLAETPEEHRQPVLDELAGRLQAEQYGAQPVYDEVRYLHHLCAEARRGRFHPNLGLKVHAARKRRREDADRAREAADARKRQVLTVRPRGESPLAEIRKQLGMRPSSTT